MQRIKIFISSVQREFAAERAMLCDYLRRDVLLGKFFEPFIFEKTPACESSAQNVFLNQVEQCDIYIGILGNQYGFEDADGLSPTEREYLLAKELSKTRLIYVNSVNEGVRHPKETKFIHRVEQEIVRKTFVDSEGLRTSVYASLVRYLEDKGYIRWRPFDASYDSGATLDDLDEEKMHTFIRMAKAKRNFALAETTPPEILLRHLDLIEDGSRVSNAAVLLFGRKPQKFFKSSEVKCVQFYGNVVEKPLPVYQIYRGDVFEMIDQAVSFVMSRIDHWVGTRAEGMTASVPTKSELPFDAVKEAIVNAVCHRDYTCNASVQVMLFRNRLEVWSPGSLPFGLTVQKLQKPHKSMPTNQLLADPMYWNGYIEKVGTGTEDIIGKCTDYGLKCPIFQQDEDFKVVLWRNCDEDREGVQAYESLEQSKRIEERESKQANQNKRIKTSESKQVKKTEHNKAKIRKYLHSCSSATCHDISNVINLSMARTRVILSSMEDVLTEGETHNRIYFIKSDSSLFSRTSPTAD